MMAMLSFFASGFIYTTNSHENIVQAAQMNNDQAVVVNLAKQQLGKPYAWGATGPNSFDCSGLTQYVFAHAVGVNLPRVTWQQETVGKDVSLNALLPGDLLFWGARGSTYHVAIYIGDGNMIQAPTTGDVVKITALRYYMPNFARRVLSEAPGIVTEGNLEVANVDRDKLNLKGWSATSDAPSRPYSYLFAMDANTNIELARWKINRVDRPDVQNAYSHIPCALHSGFNESFVIPGKLRGHNIRIMARYSADPNGDQHSADLTFDKVINVPPIVADGHLDESSTKDNRMTLRGWSASPDSPGKPYSYLLAVDANTNIELARWKINRTDRSDVQNAYPQIPGALHSGFNVTFNMPGEIKGHKVKFMSRYSSDPNGSFDTTDFTFENVIDIPPIVQEGWLEEYSVSGNKLNLKGWSASSESPTKPYSYLFAVDVKTNIELARWKINRIDRPDVPKVYPHIPGALHSGFKESFDIPAKLRGRAVKIMARYTADPEGNNESADVTFDQVINIPAS